MTQPITLTEAQKAEINRTIDQALSAVQLLCRLVGRPSPIQTREERRNLATQERTTA